MKITDSITLDFQHDMESKETACIVTKDKRRIFGFFKHGEIFKKPVGRGVSLKKVLAKKVNGELALNREERKAVWGTLKEQGVNLGF